MMAGVMAMADTELHAAAAANDVQQVKALIAAYKKMNGGDEEPKEALGN